MTKHHLTLRPAVAGNTRLIDDYVVRRDLRPVGRIYLVDPSFETGAVWEWGINLPLPTLWWCVGRVHSFEEAKVAFLDAWVRYYNELSAEQIAHWHKQQDAASARLTKPSDVAASVEDTSGSTEDVAAQVNQQPSSETD